MPVTTRRPGATEALGRLVGTALIACVTGLSADSASAASTSSALSKAQRDIIRRDLLDFSTAGMNRRLGPDYNSYNSGGASSFPSIYMPSTKQDPGGRPYQIGGPWSSDAGDYSSTQGQILYSPDAGAFGVDRVTILEWAHYTFSEKPEPPWWGGFRPEPFANDWKAATGGNPGVPVAMARGMATWANLGVVAFSSGLIGTAGTCTAEGERPMLQLPPGKVPTAVSVTSKSEFALVTVMDVNTRKGQVAVIALQGCDLPNFSFVHDWPDRYPCTPSTAWLSEMKLLGFIDLPGVEFPTGITAVGNKAGGRLNGPDGHISMLGRFNLSQQSIRDTFRTGNNIDWAMTAGFAVVVSKHENKAVFIDLQPLFQRVHDLYFTTEENFQITRNLGPGPTQFPETFEANPGWKPPVVKVITVPEPTAVIASLTGGDKARALIASTDGTVSFYKLGGLATVAPAAPADIQKVNEVKVGRNPTCLTYNKLAFDSFIAVSRGDREIAWIQNDTQLGPRVVRRLRDERLQDPVYVEMADTHGVETSLITVADFAGRKIVNYRWTPVVFATQGGAVFGMGPAGLDQFECGGTLSFPGYPFGISASNVN